MSRECKADFIKLKNYIENFSISKNLEHAAYLESLANMHKVYYSMITWNAEMEHKREEFLQKCKSCSVDIVYRLSESVSDMGSSLFNWVNGGYKTSRVMTRVAIENFVRSVSAIEDKSQLAEKNVYSLFEKASASVVFNSNVALKKAYDQLHADYKILCEDTHTATFHNMEHLSSLAGLPVFNKAKAEASKEIYIRVAKNINSIYCLVFCEFFHGMHHRNRENILHGITKEVRPIVAGID